MLKKDQVLEALENGGCIMVDSIYRTARVLDADNNEIDTCRYDTAERIEHTNGYKKTYRGGWYATWYIEKEQTAQTAAQEEAEQWAAESERVRAAVAADLPGLVQEEEQPAQDDRTPYERVIARDPDNKNAWRLPGYPGPLWCLRYTCGGYCTAYYPTKREMQDDLEQLPKRGGHDFKATYRANSASEWEEIPAETRQEETDRENREHCRRIAEEVEIYASGSAYECPHCGAVHIFEDYEETEHENKDGYTSYNCPHCGEEIEESELEAVGLYDYFADCLDIEYRCCGLREYRSVRVMVACGGPNIYIDTASKNVELYWWSDRASYPLAYDAVDAIDEWAAEYWVCL